MHYTTMTINDKFYIIQFNKYCYKDNIVPYSNGFIKPLYIFNYIYIYIFNYNTK